MRRSFLLLTSVCLAVTACSSVSASATATQPAGESLQEAGLATPIRVSAMLGFQIQNEDNEPVGVVTDLILNFDTYQIDYAIVQLADDNRLIALTWTYVLMPTGTDVVPRDILITSANQDILSAAPAFDSASVPGIGEFGTDWDMELRTYWGVNLQPADQGGAAGAGGSAAGTPATESTAQPTVPLRGVSLFTLFLGSGIQSSDGASLGSVSDLVFDMQTGAIKYILVSSDNETLSPIPIAKFGWDKASGQIVLSADQETFAAAPTFSSSTHPDYLAADWDSEFAEYWVGSGTPSPTP